MVHTEVIVKKWGNSFGLIIPSEVAKSLALKEGKKIDLDLTAKKKISGFGLAKGAKPFKREHDDREF